MHTVCRAGRASRMGLSHAQLAARPGRTKPSHDIIGSLVEVLIEVSG